MRPRRSCSSSATPSRRATGCPHRARGSTLLRSRLKAEGYPYTRRQREHQRRHDRRRPRAPAARCSRSTSRRSSIIELGGNDGLRGGNLAATRDNLDAMVARGAGRRRAACSSSACSCRPTTARPTSREFDATVRRRREGAQGCRSCPSSSKASATTHGDVPARPHPSDRGGAAAAARQRVAGAAAAARTRRVSDARAHADAAPQGRHRRAGRVRRSASTCAARRSSRSTTSRARSTFRCSTTPSARAVGTLHAQDSAFAARRARRGDRRAQHRARCSRRLRRQAARLGAARLLLARRQAQPLARARAERNRLARGAARRRLSRVSPARRRARSPTLPARFRFVVVCGLTGSGKSRLLAALAAAGAQVLDLEALARHRGSLLGDLPDDPQPSQKAFDSQLCSPRSQRFDPARPVFVESESRQDRHACSCPTRCSTRMRAAACVRVATPQRAARRAAQGEYAHFLADAGVARASACAARAAARARRRSSAGPRRRARRLGHARRRAARAPLRSHCTRARSTRNFPRRRAMRAVDVTDVVARWRSLRLPRDARARARDASVAAPH